MKGVRFLGSHGIARLDSSEGSRLPAWRMQHTV